MSMEGPDVGILKDWFERQPRVKFVCRRDWMYRADTYEIGVYWAKTKVPEEGVLIYERWLILRITFRAWLDWVERNPTRRTPTLTKGET